MARKLAVVLSFAALLLVAQNALAYHTEVNLEKVSLQEVQAALFGRPEKPGLISAGKPFKAKFDDVILTQQDAWQLTQTVQDAADLSPDSEISIRGAIDGKRFETRLESNKAGGKEAKLDGLVFRNRDEAMQFLETLRARGVRELKLEGYIDGRRVEGKIRGGKTHFEG